MSDSQKQFENDNVSVELTRHPGCQVELTVTVQPKAANVARKKAIKTINKNVSVPGFRKGKAPEKTIAAKFGGHIDREWQEEVADYAFKQALDLVKVFPLHPNFGHRPLKKLKVNSCTEEDGAVVEIQYEHEPEVPSIEIDSIDVAPVEEHEVTEEELNQALQELSEVYINFEELGEDQAVEEGHFVELDIDILGDNGGRICEDRLFEVAEGKMGQWMRNLVIGKKVGDSVEGSSEWEESSGVPEEEFQASECRLTIKKVKKGVRPEVGPELAEKVGLKTEEELRAQVEKDIQQRFKQRALEEYKGRIQDALLKTYDFDIPQLLYDEEREHWLRQRLEALKAQNIGDDLIKQKEKEIEESVAKFARQAVRFFFIARDLGIRWKLELSKEDLEREFMHQMYSVAPEDQVVNPGMEGEVLRRRLSWYVLGKKVTERLANELSQKAAS